MLGDIRDLLPRLLNDQRCVSEYSRTVAKIYDEPHDASATLYNPAHFTDIDLCSTLITKSSPSDVGIVYVTRPDGAEVVWSIIAFTKCANLPPLPRREYHTPGSLYSAVTVVAPVGAEHFTQAINGMRNVARRLATASSQKVFAPFEPRSWTSESTTCTSGDPTATAELFFSNLAFYRRKDVQDGRVAGAILDLPPISLDTNGQMAAILRSNRQLCLTDDNVIDIIDASASQSSVTSGDSVVPGQLVLVTFSLRGVYKPPRVRKQTGKPLIPRPMTAVGWCMRPTVRSVTILSKLGALVLDELRSADRESINQASSAVQSRLRTALDWRRLDDTKDIAHAVKRLRLSGPQTSSRAVDDGDKLRGAHVASDQRAKTGVDDEMHE